MLQEVILWAIVLLLLVVLVPVGIALFQRLRVPKQEARTPAAAAPPKPAPPPLQPMPDVPTTKVPPLPASAYQPAEIPKERPPDATPIPLKDTRVFPPGAEGGEPSGTEMMQWYGMLHCTSGPLEGQRFIVEDEGFYIGRDPALSQVTIPDGRVSKRHVRILPRSGKVWAIDQDSTNGTFLGKGGQRITEVQLKRGDTLVLADNVATFVYQI